MMSNLVSAKAAIRAEIKHAKKGAAYHQSLVTTLEQALTKLDSVEADAVAPKGISKKSNAGAEIERPKRGRKPGSRNKNSGAVLPSTGKDFWPSLITDPPQSAADILNAAIEKLGITPNGRTAKETVSTCYVYTQLYGEDKRDCRLRFWSRPALFKEAVKV